MRKALALLFLSVLAAAPARADVVMDYDCYTSVSGSMLPSMNNRGVVAANKPLPRLPSASVDFSYRLRVVVEGGVLGLQLVVDDAVMKEIGFDFDEGSYYEIDPSEGRHEKAALKDLEVDYLKQKAEIVRAGLAAPFSQPAGAETGRMKDYDLDIKRAILGGYILGLPCAA